MAKTYNTLIDFLEDNSIKASDITDQLIKRRSEIANLRSQEMQPRKPLEDTIETLVIRIIGTTVEDYINEFPLNIGFSIRQLNEIALTVLAVASESLIAKRLLINFRNSGYVSVGHDKFPLSGASLIYSVPQPGISMIVPNEVQPSDSAIIIDPGSATPEEIGDYLAELSLLYRMIGGSGLAFSEAQSRNPEHALV